MTFYKYSITCQDDLLTVDNAQSHVTAFRPISEAARSWSDDNIYLDYRKAFDSVNHAKLIEKLMLANVDLIVTTWTAAFLQG